VPNGANTPLNASARPTPISQILSNHLTSKEIDNIEYKIILDADLLAAIISQIDRTDQNEFNNSFSDSFFNLKSKTIGPRNIREKIPKINFR